MTKLQPTIVVFIIKWSTKTIKYLKTCKIECSHFLHHTYKSRVGCKFPKIINMKFQIKKFSYINMLKYSLVY